MISNNHLQSDRKSVEREHTVHMQSLATLINRKMLIPSNMSAYFAVEKHFLVEIMAALVREIDFDENWYIDANPDVQQAITNGIVQSGHDHYIRYGFYEHRLPYSILVDADWYTSAYSDVREAVQHKVFASAQEHFVASGYREGRFPFPDFALRSRTRSPN